MEHRFQRQSHMNMNMKMICFSVFFMYLMVGRLPNVLAYKNYTVGDSLGWFDKLAKPNIDYDKWVSGKTFSLGDFLIFNTDNNHTVTQTKNSNAYKSCDIQDENAIQWSLIDPNSTVVTTSTIYVPLTKEGPTYFFSTDYDGEQCLNGQKFAINVTHGQGLPASLRDDPSLASGPTPADSTPSPANADAGGDDQAVPDTNVPANFNHPKNVPKEDDSSDDSDDDTKKSNDASFMFSNKGILVSLIGGVLVLM